MITGNDVLQGLLSTRRNACTVRAYKGDLEKFFEFHSGTSATSDVVLAFVSLPIPELSVSLGRYKRYMLAATYAEATINRRIAAVCALLKVAYRLGVSASDGRSLIDSETVVPRRDTRGPSMDKVKQLLELPEAVHGQGSVAALRDKAMFSLLFMNGLRAGELVALNISDYHPNENRLYIKGKGMGSQKAPVTLSENAISAIDVYLGRSGHKESALFVNIARNNPCKNLPVRLSYSGLYKILARYGDQMGFNMSPHKIRHSAITALLHATQGNIVEVQRFSRHMHPASVLVYNDNREDAQGKMSKLLADLV